MSFMHHRRIQPSQIRPAARDWRPEPDDTVQTRPRHGEYVVPPHKHFLATRMPRHHDHSHHSHHDHRPSLQLYQEDSFCTTCGEDGDEPGERVFSERPILHHEDTFNSMFVEDGFDDDGAHLGPKIQELSDSSCDEVILRESYKPPLPRLRRVGRVERGTGHVKREIEDMRVEELDDHDDEDGRARFMEAMMFYGWICILVVLLKNVPGLFSALTGWGTWNGEEIGDADYDEY
ncbi:hypothetical protein ABW21_db0209110 [Orbilia brochopaga]|nr:hypothetical protein ABW21_db0209110 [Drechslerella brochopaga]